MTKWVCSRNDELSHHGIKGQKWGVRRFQNKDGSLTPAGKRRYEEWSVNGHTWKVYGHNRKEYADKAYEKAKKLGLNATRENYGGGGESKKTTHNKNSKQYKIPKNKSLHRLKIEEKYIKQGLSKEEAEQKAAKRIRTEQYVAAAAGLTVASCVAYAKYKGYTSDKVFERDTEFHRIMKLAEGDEIRNGRQYLAVDKKDRIKYKGLLADQFKQQIDFQNEIKRDIGQKPITDAVYDVTVKNKDKVRVASRKKAEDAFVKLYNEDADFRKGLQDRAKELSIGFSTKKLNGMAEKIGEGKINGHNLRTKGYDIFNVMLTDNDERSVKNASKFYDALRLKGANAIDDINDRKYSGYGSKMPIITFDGDFDYVKRKMDNSEIISNNKKATNMLIRPMVMQNAALFVGSFGGTAVVGKRQMDKKVLMYKKEHPNTKMSDSEIREMIKEELANGQKR